MEVTQLVLRFKAHLSDTWSNIWEEIGGVIKVPIAANQVRFKIANIEPMNWTDSSQKRTQMAQKYFWKCSTPLLIKEIQIKSTWKFQLSPVRITIIYLKKETITTTTMTTTT